MCFQDIQIGRNSYSAQTIVSVSTSFVELAAPNPYRTSIVISSPPSNNLLVTTNPNMSSTVGLNLGANNDPLHFDIQHNGDLVRQGFYGQMSTGTQSIVVWETFLHATNPGELY